MDVSENIVVINYTRAPYAFREALENGKELQRAREALTQAEFSYILTPSGAKIFVQPYDYATVYVDLLFRSDLRLRPSSVIVSESYRPALDACVDALKRSQNVRVKNTIELYHYDEFS